MGSLLAGVPAGAQGASGRAEVFVGSELESYLRFLQTDGAVPLYPWSIRGFSPVELDRLGTSSPHPWGGHFDLDAGGRPGFRIEIIRPSLATHYNSGFPFGSNDGAVWAGRGLTTVLSGGVAARWGPLSLTLAPILFRAENEEFALAPNAYSDSLPFADEWYPTSVDRPQRFGNGAYTVFDPGQSTLRLDTFGVALGASTANQGWGPGSIYPMILGANAAGFPHVFFGTSRPANLWLVRAHARVVYGELSQSSVSPITGSARRRFMSGYVAALTPRGVPGLELGAARFYHTPWPAGGLTSKNFTRLFEAFLKKNLPDLDSLQYGGDLKSTVDNELASVFLRWVLPRSGFEVYGEFAREDHSWDKRDLILNPDHSSGSMVGFRKMWRQGETAFRTLRAEAIAFEPRPMLRTRSEGQMYVHGRTQQGHTQRGQMLGADVGAGAAAGSTIGTDWYSSRGRSSVQWSYARRQSEGNYWRTGVEQSRHADVLHAFTVERLRFHDPADLSVGVTAVYELNRDLQRDAFNLNLSVGLQWGGFRPPRSQAAPR